MELRPIARALAHRNFRLFIIGQGISLIGTWMQQLALGWLVFRLTNSAFLLGLVGFSGQIPAFFLAPIACVLSDRWDKRRALVTQTAAMIQALLLAVLDASGTIEVWQVVVLSIFAGLVNAFDVPTRQAFLTQTVDRREDLSNAIALNSSIFNMARLVGPALAALLINAAGEVACFFVNALSFLAVIASLLAMRITPQVQPAKHPAVLEGLKIGVAYAFGFPPVRTLLLLLALMSLSMMPITVLLPVFASKILHGNAGTLGLLTSASGLGALMGALYLASRKQSWDLVVTLAWAAGAFGLAASGFAWSTSLWLSVLLLFLAGLAMMVHMAASNTLLQTIVDDDKRGRVMGLYTTAFMGMAPVGSLLAGVIADEWGAPNAVRLSGVITLCAAAWFFSRLPALRDQVRPIYVRMGIIPEIARGLEATSELRVPPEL